MPRVKAVELRQKNRDELMNEIEKYKKELSQLRVAQVTQGAPAKLAQIKVVRKNIARALTVLSHQKRAALKEHFANAKYVPTDLRIKKTRAMRRALTKEQAAKKTLRQQKKERAFPMKKFALKA
ncbi:hypothetical protein WA538_001338 [Blastocystis sp. DL]